MADPKPKPPSQTTRLLALTTGIRVFHSQEQAFAILDVPAREGVPAHCETWPIRAPQFAQHLTTRFLHAHQSAPAPNVMKAVLATLEARARCDAPEAPVFLRVAEHKDAIYLDLCNDRWEVVRITAGGWNICAESPVHFIRAAGMESLPRPESGGTIDDLRTFVNVEAGDDWVLLVAWIAMCFRPRGPFPILILHGGEGCAKTTTGRVIRSLVDPNRAPLRSAPSGERDLMIAATNSRLLAFDNLSSLPAGLSDALCRVTTEGSFATREIYTSTGETLLTAQRPVLLNGIEQLATRADLLSRAVLLTLPRIAEDARRAESALLPTFDGARPRILGAILTAVAGALRELPQVRLPRRPRMADFAEWATAMERALGWPDGTFQSAYEKNLALGSHEVLTASPLASAVLELASRGAWEGTPSELLEALQEFPGRLPTTAQRLGVALSRVESALRRVGVDIIRNRSSTARTIRIEAVARKDGTHAHAA